VSVAGFNQTRTIYISIDKGRWRRQERKAVHVPRSAKRRRVTRNRCARPRSVTQDCTDKQEESFVYAHKGFNTKTKHAGYRR
jgi:hypothetical protein